MKKDSYEDKFKKFIEKKKKEESNQKDSLSFSEKFKLFKKQKHTEEVEIPLPEKKPEKKIREEKTPDNENKKEQQNAKKEKIKEIETEKPVYDEKNKNRFNIIAKSYLIFAGLKEKIKNLQSKKDEGGQDKKTDDANSVKKNFMSKLTSTLSNLKSRSNIEKVKKELIKSDDKEKKKKAIEKKDEIKRFQTNLELIQNKKKKRKIKVSRYERRRILKEYLEKAGFNVSDETKISTKINYSALILLGIFSFYLIYAGIIRGDRFLFVLTQVITSWLIVGPSLVISFWSIFYVVVDFKIYGRKKQLEEVLPDFLQLTSANLNAGMPLDQALWYAVRPRFGILAKEIEEVAKSTLVGEELKDALLTFSSRYESKMLNRTVNLMLEGLDAGGEIGPLLNKISVDIQETNIIRRDMSANVTTYVIFITFATVVAAPFLFALSSQLLSIITHLVGNINIPKGVSSPISFSIGDGASITTSDFFIFAIGALCVTSFFSASIVSIIQKGNIKDGIKYIPTFILISIIIFIISRKVLGYFLSGILV